MREIWRPIKGSKGYEVSNFGNVRSIDRVVYTARGPRVYKGKTLKPGPSKSGHLSVVLGRGKNGSQVHTLVMEAFVGPRYPGLDIRHLDGNPINNKLCNLEYGTRTENILDVFRCGKAWRKLDIEQAKAIKVELAKGKRGRHIARDFGVAESTVSAIKKGRLYAWLDV